MTLILPPTPLSTRLRTRALWWTMRVVPYERLRRWHERGWSRPVERLVLRGDVQMLGGYAPRIRMSAAHFEPWGAQAFTVLTGTHETQVQEALRRALPPGGTFVDVGANLGATTLLAAAIVGERGRVVAIEAQPEMVAAVRANAARNGFGQVTVIHAAAAASSGEAELIVVSDPLWTRLASVGEHELEARRDTVRAVALDDLVESGEVPQPDVVKIDVEGAELDVLAGMRRMLERDRPVVVCEMHGKNAAFAELMRKAGYRVTNLDGTEPVEDAGGNVHALCEPPER